MALGASGQSLWDAVHESRDVSDEYIPLLLNACRIADRLDELSGSAVPLTVVNSKGDEVANPVFTEHRMQLQTLRSVMSALGIDRLPEAAEESESFEDSLARARAAVDNPELRVVR